MTINAIRIESILAERDMTKAALAERCGVSRQNISTIIRRGTCEPRTAGSRSRCQRRRDYRGGAIMTPYQKIPEACKSTGLSQYFLRNGCKNGTIPHVKSGPTYYIDVPALLEKLRGETNGHSGSSTAL